MPKLTLNVEMLAVESFAPAEAVAPRGTVAGHSIDGGDTDLDILTCAGSCPADCEHDAVFVLTNDGRETCTYSCPGKCFNTNMLSTQCC
ncbi:hypothetical protein [Longimicrobium sp.]|uniref:hypothetical protein n=1 Tax=Longimicrobium sp. TaxID=2029185 RepID=UPI002E367EA7|nr:hypothetical protein [Longimicrobium sp.]HEX6036536.1 hypothetical protein [Longimicrobium sp.]